MKMRKISSYVLYLVLGGLAVMGIFAGGVYAAGSPYLATTTGGIKIGEDVNPGSNTLAFKNSGYISTDDGQLHLDPNGNLMMTTGDAFFIMNQWTGNVRINGKPYQGRTSRIVANSEGSTWIDGGFDDTEGGRATFVADNDGYAYLLGEETYMMNHAGASVTCTPEGDVVIQLGAGTQAMTQQLSGPAHGDTLYTERMQRLWELYETVDETDLYYTEP